MLFVNYLLDLLGYFSENILAYWSIYSSYLLLQIKNSILDFKNFI